MNEQVGLDISIHGNLILFSYCCPRGYVVQKLVDVPYFTKIGEVANHVGTLGTSVHNKLEAIAAGLYVV